MKRVLLALCAPAILLLFGGCDNLLKDTVTYKINEPVFMPIGEVVAKTKVTTQAYEITGHGKICFYNDYLYLAEPDKGIHIINNSDPANPVQVGFIEIVGNHDIMIRENMLYADMLTSLVWFDVSDPAHPELKGHLEDVFHFALPETENEHGIDYEKCYNNVPQGQVVVGWRVKERKESYSKWGTDDIMYESSSLAGSANKMSNSVNGSMSRFAIYKNYLYTVIDNKMDVFDLAGDEPSIAAQNIYVGWDVETIFSYKDCMFMGTPFGMIIFSVENPLKPEYQSSVTHVFGCDPVVVEDDIAYVTVHSGNLCGQNANDLIIVDVSDTKNPRHIVTYAMTKPKGLGIDQGTLFVCDDGLKIFNAEDPQTIMANRLAHYKGMEGYDLIPYNKTLMMIAEDGIYQYDYSDLEGIRKLSKIAINAE